MATIGVGLATLIAGGAVSGAQAYSAKAGSSAADKATRAQQQAAARAEKIELENEQRRRAEWDKTEAENKRRWEVEQGREQQRYETEIGDKYRSEAKEQARYDQLQAVRAPYRATGAAALQDLAARAGLSIKPTAPPPMPEGWSSSSMTPPRSAPSFDPKQYLGDKDSAVLSDLRK